MAHGVTRTFGAYKDFMYIVNALLLLYYMLYCYHRNIKFKAPYSMGNERRSIHHTYLDTIGRPVVVINKDNLVEHHIADFEV